MRATPRLLAHASITPPESTVGWFVLKMAVPPTTSALLTIFSPGFMRRRQPEVLAPGVAVASKRSASRITPPATGLPPVPADEALVVCVHERVPPNEPRVAV